MYTRYTMNMDLLLKCIPIYTMNMDLLLKCIPLYTMDLDLFLKCIPLYTMNMDLFLKCIPLYTMNMDLFLKCIPLYTVNFEHEILSCIIYTLSSNSAWSLFTKPKAGLKTLKMHIHGNAVAPTLASLIERLRSKVGHTKFTSRNCLQTCKGFKKTSKCVLQWLNNISLTRFNFALVSMPWAFAWTSKSFLFLVKTTRNHHWGIRSWDNPELKRSQQWVNPPLNLGSTSQFSNFWITVFLHFCVRVSVQNVYILLTLRNIEKKSAWLVNKIGIIIDRIELVLVQFTRCLIFLPSRLLEVCGSTTTTFVNMTDYTPLYLETEVVWQRDSPNACFPELLNMLIETKNYLRLLQNWLWLSLELLEIRWVTKSFSVYFATLDLHLNVLSQGISNAKT